MLTINLQLNGIAQHHQYRVPLEFSLQHWRLSFAELADARINPGHIGSTTVPIGKCFRYRLKRLAHISFVSHGKFSTIDVVCEKRMPAGKKLKPKTPTVCTICIWTVRHPCIRTRHVLTQTSPTDHCLSVWFCPKIQLDKLFSYRVLNIFCIDSKY